MKRRMRERFAALPLRRQLFIAILGVCGATLLFAIACIAVIEAVSYRRALRDNSVMLADVIGKASEAAIAFADRTEADRTLAAFSVDTSVREAALYDLGGGRIGIWLAAGEASRLERDPALTGFDGGMLFVSREIRREGRLLGRIALRVDLGGLYQRLALLTTAQVLVLAGALAAAIVLTRSLQRPLSDPIQRLAATARHIAETGDVGTRAAETGGHELRDLAYAINRMLDRIEGQNRTLREQADELRRSNDELEQFSYISSHDLKEPLRMVSMYIDLLATKYGAALPEQARGYLATVASGAARMHSLIEDILAYARVDRPRDGATGIALEAVVAEAVENLRPEIERTGAQVRVQPLPVVRGARSQLVQLVQNLIGNAIKYRRETPLITISARREGDRWTIAIDDNGIGIAPEHLDRIFVMFQRLHGREAYGGNGIGLTICRRIVERHGGRIWVESQPGVGSSFRFTLPAVEADAGAAPVERDACPEADDRTP